jgi:hypothetical protein
MADYVASALLAAQAKITPKYNEAELRERQDPILRVGLANQDYLMQDVSAIKESEKRTVHGYQFKRISAVNGTTRSHNFSGSQGDSAEVDLNWATYTETLGIYLNVGVDNVLSYAEVLANQIAQAQRNIRERIGKAFITSLHAGRTATSNATVRNANFNPSSNAFEIAQADKDQFFAFVKSVMTQHKYYGQLDLMVDSVLDPFARKIAAQGTNNGENLNYSLQGFQNIMTHNALGVDVAVADYTSGGVAIALPANSFSFIPWIPSRYRNGFGNALSTIGLYATMPDNTGLPFSYSLRGYATKADGSSNGGTVDDVKVDWQLGIDIATQIAEISAASESPVYEFALLNP